MAKAKKSQSENDAGRVQVTVSPENIRKMDHICAETKESRPQLMDRLLGPALNDEWQKIKKSMGL